MERFTWIVDVGSGVEDTYRVKSAQFGNGYVQDVGDGVNTLSEKWNISVFGLLTNINPIRAFLRSHGSFTPFLWKTPMGDEITVKGKDVRVTSQGADAYTLTAVFEQHFYPTV